MLAFDTRPGNLPLDAAMRLHTGEREAFDRDGRLASTGVPQLEWVARWLRHPFFLKRPPKSTGREAFGAEDLERRWRDMDTARLGAADRLATLTEFVVRSIALNFRRHLPGPPDCVVVCGGGVKNRFLMNRLESALREAYPNLDWKTCEAFGWPPETVEGAAFALLARERLLGRPGNLPATTGARRAVGCGQVTWSR